MIPSISAARASSWSLGSASEPSSPISPVTSVPDMTGTYNGSTLSPVLPNVACAAASTPG